MTNKMTVGEFRELIRDIPDDLILFNPNQQAARFAPAAICCIIKRIQTLRKMIEQGQFKSPEIAKLQQIVEPISFEKELTSGDLDLFVQAMIANS